MKKIKNLTKIPATIQSIPIPFLVVEEPELPFPWVHYRRTLSFQFMAFQHTRDGALYHCACQEEAMMVYWNSDEYWYSSPFSEAQREQFAEILKGSIQFRERICHVCCRVLPRYCTGQHDGGTRNRFYHVFGAYVDALMYEYGVSTHGRVLDSMLLPEDIADQFADQLIAKEMSFKEQPYLDEVSRTNFRKYCERVIRKRIGYPLGKERWKTEYKVWQMVQELYPSYRVIHQYEVDDLWIDVFVEELQLAIEYQGVQHFRPIAFMGGEYGFQKRQQNDERKRELCAAYGYRLLEITYTDPLAPEWLQARIQETLMG